MDNRKKIVIYDSNMKRLAYLDKAFDISYTTKRNALWTASFKLPTADHKNEYCKPYHYAELFDNGQRVELFRIMPTRQEKGSSNTITYNCEHVLATLMDSVLFKYHQIGNIGAYTTQVLRYIIDHQIVKHWRLGRVEFARQFEYKWENENLLAALFSVPQPFTEAYEWTYDTTSYPWTINLVKSDTVPSCEIRYRKNMQSITKIVDPTNLVTRLYCLGYGEGDNQLNIQNINGGKAYLEVDSPYGIKEAIFVDRRYEDENSLKAAGQALLNEVSVPYISYTVDAIDISQKSESEYDRFLAGKLVHVIDQEDGLEFNAYITETTKTIGEATPKVTIANKEKDLAGSISELQERARINETYSQGATNLMQIAYADNADKTHPAKLKVYIPAEMVRINKLILQFQLEPFRAFSKATGGGGSSSDTTSGGGGYADSTDSGGGSYDSTDSGGGGYDTTGVDSYTGSSYGGHNHGIWPGTYLAIWGGVDENGNVVSDGYVEWVKSGNHDHRVEIPNHRHDFSIPDHYHSFSIPSHSHRFSIPEHTHTIEQGIFEGSTAKKVTIKVDDRNVPVAGNEINIAPYLATSDGGKITRNAWHEIEITPDALTRIIANVFIQLFVNSRGEGDY